MWGRRCRRGKSALIVSAACDVLSGSTFKIGSWFLRGFGLSADYNVQNAYLFGQMESRQRSRRYHKLQRVVGQSRRTRTWKYTAVTVSSCRFMGFVRHVFVLLEVSVSHLKFSHLLLIAGLTMKLGHEKISDESQQCVRDHISSFPRYTIIIAVLPLLLSTLVDELSIETN